MSQALPDFSGGFVQIHDEADPLRSDTTLLAVTLLTLGIPQHGGVLFHCTWERARGETKCRSTWTLASESKDKRFLTARMRAAWDDPAWLAANPRHPLTILRTDLSYQRAFAYTPRFTWEELARIERPETWLEAGIRNLIWVLRQMPRVVPEAVVRFGPDHAGAVPINRSEADKARFLRFVEHPAKRTEIIRAA